MRVLITGGAGLLGAALVRHRPEATELHATVRSRAAPGGVAHRIDLAEARVVASLLDAVRPDLVIHTAYDPADLQRGVVLASAAVATACAELGAGLIHLSSDRVLDGDHAPYDETAPPNPVEPYGEAKAEAERRVRGLVPDAAIVRTSLIVGTDPPDRISAGVLRELGAGRPTPLFVDEIRCPIHVADLARQIWSLAEAHPVVRAGTWNLVGPEALSRFALGALVARRFGVRAEGLVPALNRSHPTPRPRDLRLTTARADAELRPRARPISEALFAE